MPHLGNEKICKCHSQPTRQEVKADHVSRACGQKVFLALPLLCAKSFYGNVFARAMSFSANHLCVC